MMVMVMTSILNNQWVCYRWSTTGSHQATKSFVTLRIIVIIVIIMCIIIIVINILTEVNKSNVELRKNKSGNKLTRELHSTHELALLPRGTIRTLEEASSKQTDILDQKVHVLQKINGIGNQPCHKIHFKNSSRDACSTADIINASLLVVYYF